MLKEMKDLLKEYGGVLFGLGILLVIYGLIVYPDSTEKTVEQDTVIEASYDNIDSEQIMDTYKYLIALNYVEYFNDMGIEIEETGLN